jgi:hypothetical protein
MTDRILKLLTWPAALFIADILLWHARDKLAGNPSPVWLFTVLSNWIGLHGFEKPFRLGVASAEIVASVLVVLPWTRIVGAALAFGVMSGAIFFHLAGPLGIDPYTDGGKLFTEACGVWLCSAFVLFAWRREASALVERWTGVRLLLAWLEARR